MEGDWEQGLRQAEKMLDRQYGATGLQVRPYKFLLYGPGGHFKMHRDTEKEDRMFATMVVQLPSTHRGGELQVMERHMEAAVNGDMSDDSDDEDDMVTKTHDFGQSTGTAPDRCHYAVHYADH